MEMQEQSLLNEMMSDEVHEIEDEQQDYRGPITRSRSKTLEPIETSMVENHDQDEGISQEGLPILIHVEKYEGGPVYGTFLQKDIDLGKTDKVKHTIKLDDYTPFKERYRCIPPHQYEEVKQHLKEMLGIGAVNESKSPWASAVVLVSEKDGSLRFCIDLRKLNARTVKDAYSLPRIEETLDCLNGAQWFTSLDLKLGYWQVELDEESKALSAFTVGPLGFYQCEHMPCGLTNAPATFQRLMESCLGDMHLKWVIIYLDDIIIFSKTPKEHIQRLRGVFQKLHEVGLKLKLKKCEFFKTRISYLGHIVSQSWDRM